MPKIKAERIYHGPKSQFGRLIKPFARCLRLFTCQWSGRCWRSTAHTQSNGSTWDTERDAVDFLRDDIVVALAQALKMSSESAGQWFDRARDDYRINIEGFASLVNEYLTTRPAGHKVIFLVDEVGQFTLIEAAAAKPVHQVATPGNTAQPVHTGQPNLPPPVSKPTKVIRAADFSTKSYLESEADVEAFVTQLRAELLTAVRSGQKARLQ